MTNNNNEKNNIINIDSDLYEELSVMAMLQGYDDVTKFINNLLEWDIMVGVGLDDKLK
jgi:hypothetical protein